jgi:hypothetical protein
MEEKIVYVLKMLMTSEDGPTEFFVTVYDEKQKAIKEMEKLTEKAVHEGYSILFDSEWRYDLDLDGVCGIEYEVVPSKIQ